MNWFDEYLKNSPMEDELMKMVDAENKAFNELPTTVAHNATIKRLFTLWSKVRKERITNARKKHEDEANPRKLLPEEMGIRREQRAERKKEEFEAMPQEYKDAVNTFGKLNDELKRKFIFDSQRNIVDDSLPKHENPKTSEKDIKDLQEILVQDVIDFLNARGLQEVDTVSFHIDGLGDSLKHEQWTPSSDSSIRFEGLTDDDIRSRTFIGEYM
jgi:hypothetical protein